MSTSPNHSRRTRIRLAVTVASAALFSLTNIASAQDRPAFLDPTLAISIEADSAELSQEKNVSIYRGNVRLERGPLVMSGQELKVSRSDKNDSIRAELSGGPARAVYTDPNNTSVPVIATAETIAYTTVSEVLELRVDAKINRGEDALSGESIRYEIPAARIQASGDDRERVRITIKPPEESNTP